MTERTVRREEGGTLKLHYDPKIAVPFGQTVGRDVDLWSTWDRITSPVLALRGAHSDLLLVETAAEMQTRGPAAAVVEIPRCGHAPALADREQIATITEWLTSTSA